ncbi:MerR family transcriptional regulator [Thermobispora bispora]|nr:MerR family transcriptional regulator [Thermobispora bispora]
MLKELTMQIGELARRAGVSTRALRYYEQVGLLAPARAANGYREYDELDLIHARNIRDLLAIGLTTEDIRGYLEKGCLDRPLEETPRCAAELTTVEARLRSLDERISRLQRLRDRLARHGEEIRRAIENGEAVR